MAHVHVNEPPDPNDPLFQGVWFAFERPRPKRGAARYVGHRELPEDEQEWTIELQPRTDAVEDT